MAQMPTMTWWTLDGSTFTPEDVNARLMTPADTDCPTCGALRDQPCTYIGPKPGEESYPSYAYKLERQGQPLKSSAHKYHAKRSWYIWNEWVFPNGMTTIELRQMWMWLKDNGSILWEVN